MVRFTVWMTLGLIMYFYYGITHSLLENAQEEIELTADQTHLAPPPHKANSSSNHYSNQTPTAVWDRHGYENKMAEDSWTTAATVTNNYSTNSWDISDLNSAWNDPAPTRAESAGDAKKPSIPPRSGASGGAAASSSSSSKGGQSRPPPPPKPSPKAPTQPAQPKSGFSGIFIDETQFPSWDD